MDEYSSIYRVVLESVRAVPWCLDWSTKKFRYMGPQIANLLGWEQTTWRSVDDWVDRIHPLDREAVVSFCAAQSEKGLNHEADYRMITSNGSFIWVRDVVHVVRQTGRVDSLVGLIIDISDRSAVSTSSQAREHKKNPSTVDSNNNIHIYRFTPAELQLASALISGRSASEYAAFRGVSVNTVRCQIRSLLEKTGLNRQTDLIRLLIANQPKIRPSSQLRLQHID